MATKRGSIINRFVNMRFARAYKLERRRGRSEKAAQITAQLEKKIAYTYSIDWMKNELAFEKSFRMKKKR